MPSSTLTDIKTKSTSRFSRALLSIDQFPEPLQMQMDGGKTSIGSPIGALCSILMLIVVIAYAAQKTVILVNGSDTNLQVTRLEDFFQGSESLTAKDDGLFFAFSFYNYLTPNTPVDYTFFSTAVFEAFNGDIIFHTTHACTDDELSYLFGN